MICWFLIWRIIEPSGRSFKRLHFCNLVNSVITYNRMNKKTSWGAVADWYGDLIETGKDTYQKNVIAPNLVRIIAPKAGMNILDVACGQGYFSRIFAQKGAKVIGCDISPELIDLAKKENATSKEGNKPDFFVASADQFVNKLKEKYSLLMPESGFDCVTIILALQNIEKYSETIAECSSVLKKGGKLVLVLNHPAFRIPQNSSWQWEEKDGLKQYRRIDSYMSDKQFEIDMTPGEEKSSKKKYTVSFHRPLQTFFKAFAKSGLAVTRLEEWISHKKSQPGPRSVEEDRMRKEIPMFICLEAVKV